MPGKPHKTSFSEKIFTVKDGKSLNSEWEGINLASISTVSSTANFFCWPAIATATYFFLNPHVTAVFDSWR